MPVEASLIEILACPACHAGLAERSAPADGAATDQGVDAELVCVSADCGLAYPIRDGIPVLLVDEASRPA